jgi:hypothetical protein
VEQKEGGTSGKASGKEDTGFEYVDEGYGN